LTKTAVSKGKHAASEKKGRADVLDSGKWRRPLVEIRPCSKIVFWRVAQNNQRLDMETWLSRLNPNQKMHLLWLIPCHANTHNKRITTHTLNMLLMMVFDSSFLPLKRKKCRTLCLWSFAKTHGELQMELYNADLEYFALNAMLYSWSEWKIEKLCMIILLRSHYKLCDKLRVRNA
jgi:hypothetical protein